MKTRFRPTFLGAILSLLSVISCEQEIMDMNERLDNLEGRLSRLETLVNEMNSNISSLQGIVTAMQAGDYITSVTPLTENGETIGYSISFAKGDPITIYHGKNGANGENGQDGKDGENGKDGLDGHTPVIGIKQDIDGIWYWTLDDEWLLDANGQKVRAVGIDGKDGANGQDGQNGTDGKDGADGKDGQNGTDGKDGITPQLMIQDGYWYISMDNGQTWAQLGKATGEDGKDGTNGKDGKDGDSMFQSVTVTDAEVIFVTADGQSFVVKRAVALSIAFDSEDLVVMGSNATRDIHYAITSSSNDITIEAMSSTDIKVKVVKTDEKNGVLNVKTGATIDEYSKVAVLVSDNNQAIIRTLSFEEEAIEVEEGTTKEVSDDGGEILLEYFSNVPCNAVILEDAQSWISVVPGTKAMTKNGIVLNIKSNDGDERQTTVIIQTNDGSQSISFEITQRESRIIQQAREKDAMIEIWKSLNGEHWEPQYWEPIITWREDNPIENWAGLSFNERGAIKEIRISSLVIDGFLPDVFDVFKDLEYLEITGGKLSGSFPASIGRLGKLEYLEISGDFSGELPDLSGLINLNTMRLNGASFNNGIPSSIGMLKNLEILFLPYCKLTGEIPDEIGLLTKLTLLDLSGNHLTGEIPSSIVNLSNLETLNLSANLLSGTIPEHIGNLNHLKTLNLKGHSGSEEYENNPEFRNHLHGPIPESLGNLSQLQYLNLSENDFSGQIPEFIWNLPQLDYLDLSFNEFCGELSHSIGNAQNLYNLNLCTNLLTGPIPDEFWNNKRLEFVDLSNHFSRYGELLENKNRFSGNLSPMISNLTQLYSFTIANNQLEGEIPTSIIELTELNTLKLSNNNLTGTIPDGIKNMENLLVFWCYDNRLSGLLSYEFLSTMAERNSVYSMSWMITDQQEGYGFDYDLYESTDYSQNGVVKMLQTATEGNGINIILIGDAFVDTDIKSGLYDSVMEQMYEAIFEEEPYKSFKDFFNVYEIVTVSKNNTDIGETALNIKSSVAFNYSCSHDHILAVINDAIPNLDIDELTVSIATPVAAEREGVCFMLNPPFENQNAYGCGIAISHYSSSINSTFAQTVKHEVGGHGFGKLADEYVDSGSDSEAPETESSLIASRHDKNWYVNVDATSDPESIYWSPFLSLSNYTAAGLGVYEGGNHYAKGVWRSTVDSIMRDSHNEENHFNAVSREAIYKRIHKLAYGDSWIYNIEDFLEWDKKNMTSEPLPVRKRTIDNNNLSEKKLHNCCFIIE